MNAKVDEVEEYRTPVMQDILASLMRRKILNDESPISSNITMDTHMDAVESNMATTNTNIVNLDDLVNYIHHVLRDFRKEFNQGTNLAPAEISAKVNEQKLTRKKIVKI